MNEAKCPDCGEDMSNRRNGVDYAHTCVGHKHTSYLCLPHEQTLEGMIEARDAEIARLNALLAEAREGLEMCERNDRSEPYGYANKGAPEASYRRAGDGAVPEVGKRWKTPHEIARAILAKLGA